MNHAESYAQLRPANVAGTVEVLRLAAEGRLKPVHYVSTLSVVAAGPEDPDVLPEDWVSEPQLLGGSPYPRTKWAAEALIRQAAERGVPAAVYRLSRVGGDSNSGAVSDHDALWHYVRACVEIGARPAQRVAGAARENLVPVDFVARAFVRLALEGTNGRSIVNLTAPTVTSWSEVLDHAEEFGYRFEELPAMEWRRRLGEAARALTSDRSSSLTAVSLLFDGSGSAGGTSRTPTDYSREVLDNLAGSGLACPPTDESMVFRTLRWLVGTGFLPEPTAAGQDPADDQQQDS